MRFDLEIPSTNNIELTYIREGAAIPTSVAPLMYCSMDDINAFPSDFISAQANYRPREFAVGGYETVDGPLIVDIKSDQFLITNIAKYASLDGAKLPLFYKHVIFDKVKEEAIKIVDYFGVELDKSLYHVEQYDNKTFIFTNKYDRVMFIQYVSEFTVLKTILNLVPVFTEASWGDINAGDVSKYKYILRNRAVRTSHNEPLYISYASDGMIFRSVKGNLDDQWFAGVLNIDFVLNGSRYWVPEYYLQELDGDFRYKLVEHKKCYHLFGPFVQSQYTIGYNSQDNITVFVYDRYSKKLKHVFTTETALEGSLYKDSVYYAAITDYNVDGIIHLPVEIDDRDSIYITHYTNEPYFEYKGLDLSSSIVNTIDYIAIYIKPNCKDTDSSIGHAIIGADVGPGSFDDLASYYSYASTNELYTIAVLTTVNNLDGHGIKMVTTIAEGNQIFDKKETCKKSIDVLIEDLANGILRLPINDSVIAVVDSSRVMEDGKIAFSRGADNQIVLDSYGLEYMDKVLEIVKKNLDASTFSALEITIPKLITRQIV